MFEHYGWFVDFLNRSFAAGTMVLAVIILRYVLKRAPKRFWPPLWGLVALRLVLPWTVSSRLSIFNLLSSLIGRNETGEVHYFRYNGHSEKPMVEFFTPAVADNGMAGRSLSVRLSDMYLPTAIQFWLIIAITILFFAMVGYIILRRKVAASVKIEDRLYLCDDIGETFILGILRPRIYLPSGVEGETKACVIAHERAHLKRLDYIWKPFGFLLMTANWFNPLIWLGYTLFCRDLESACDETVVEKMDTGGRFTYSQALLSCATRHRVITVCPLAFGEIGVKERVKNVLNYKKAGFWIIIVTVVACIVVAVCFLTGPEKETLAIDSAAESNYTDIFQRASQSDGAESEAVADELALAYDEDAKGLLIAMEGCTPELREIVAQLLVYGKAYGDLATFAEDVQQQFDDTMQDGSAVSAILQAIGAYNMANTGTQDTGDDIAFVDNYYNQWISSGYIPWYMQNNTILIVDGDGNCTIEQGGPLTAADVEGRPDVNQNDLNFATAQEKWPLESNTKIEYDLHGFLNNIYYEVPNAPGTYQLEKP